MRFVRSPASVGSLATRSLVVAASLVVGCASPSEDEVASSESELQCAGACSGGTLAGDRLLTPVDKQNGLRSELRSEAKDAFEAMAHAAYESFAGGQRIDLYCVSGYRPPSFIVADASRSRSSSLRCRKRSAMRSSPGLRLRLPPMPSAGV